MMFHIHSTLAIELIALVAGVFLHIFIKNQPKIKHAWFNFVAWVVIILSALSILCTVFQSASLWNKGYFQMEKSIMMHRSMNQNE
jgi:hypothetical protein